jgi:hypothetical protein
MQTCRVWSLLISFFIFVPTLSYAIDIENGIRNIRRHQKWMSLELRHSLTGLFLASRAATEDKNKDATLNITLIREENRCRETIEVLFKLESPAEKEVWHDGLMEFALDNQRTQLLPTKVAMTKGDYFVFMQVAGGFQASTFKGHKTILVNARGWGLAEFSLLGFPDAWKTTQEKCSAFVSH